MVVATGGAAGTAWAGSAQDPGDLPAHPVKAHVSVSIKHHTLTAKVKPVRGQYVDVQVLSGGAWKTVKTAKAVISPGYEAQKAYGVAYKAHAGKWRVVSHGNARISETISKVVRVK